MWPSSGISSSRVVKALPGLLRRLEVGLVAGDALFQGGGQRRQGGVLVGGLAEGAEEEGGFSDGGQALAPHVADHHPGSGVDTGGRVQVAADLGLVLGGQVQGGDPQWADALREGPEQDVLCGFGHRPHLGQFPSAPLAQHAVEHDQGREHGEGEDLHHHVAGGQHAEVQADECLGREGQDPDHSGHQGTGEGGGDRGRDDQQWPQMDVLRHQDVHHGDHDNEHHRDHQQRMARPPWLPQTCKALPEAHVIHSAPPPGG